MLNKIQHKHNVFIRKTTMDRYTSNKFKIKNFKILFGILLSTAFLNPTYAIDDPKLSSDVQEVLKMMQDPKYKNDFINNLQYQNDTELTMFLMKSIEDKGIKDTNKKIEFVNTFKVSEDIKEQVKSYIRQGINYSDHEKVSYGIYLLKKCDKQNISVNNRVCYFDYAPKPAPRCLPVRSNVCCVG